MDLHAKILATLWILAVVMWIIFWIAPDYWTSEYSPKRGYMKGYTLVTLAVSAVAILDAIIYGLKQVWS